MIFFWILILVAEIWTISNTGTADEALPQKKKNETKQNRRHKETMACIFRNNETYSVEGKKDEPLDLSALLSLYSPKTG